eukprot:1934994-Prymnesium_polylepis.1
MTAVTGRRLAAGTRCGWGRAPQKARVCVLACASGGARHSVVGARGVSRRACRERGGMQHSVRACVCVDGQSAWHEGLVGWSRRRGAPRCGLCTARACGGHADRFRVARVGRGGGVAAQRRR